MTPIEAIARNLHIFWYCEIIMALNKYGITAAHRAGKDIVGSWESLPQIKKDYFIEKATLILTK